MKVQQGSSLVRIATAGALLAAVSAMAATTITTFDYFVSDELYASWASPSAIIDSGPTAYTITATGYGSNYKYTPVDGTGNTNVELTVTLSGPPAADGHLGPIIGLVDADGTYANYAWYGQLLGTHVLTMPIATPTWIASPGTTPGLDVATINHLHLQLDPGGFGTQGAYTVAWEHLRLTGAPPPAITNFSFNQQTLEFSLTWTSSIGKLYTVAYSTNATGPYAPLATDIPAIEASTTTSVIMPEGDKGFLRILEQ